MVAALRGEGLEASRRARVVAARDQRLGVGRLGRRRAGGFHGAAGEQQRERKQSGEARHLGL